MTPRRNIPAPDGPLGLLIAILSDTPRLPGALCRDHPDLFAATHATGQGAMTGTLAEARTAAKAVCAACPALAACETWVTGLPVTRRPAGIVAGHLAGHSALKPTATQRNLEGQP